MGLIGWRKRRILGIAGGLALFAALTLGGCSDEGPSRDEVVEALVEGGVDRQASVCAVNGFYDDVSTDGLEQIVAGSESLTDADDQAAFTASFRSCTAAAFQGDTPVDG